MPIEKVDGVILRKLDLGFDIIPRQVIDSLETSDQIAMYTLLMTRPNNWVIRKEWVKDRLKIGEDRYRAARQKLEDLDIWTVAKISGEDGKMQGSVIWFNPLPPRYLKTDMSETPRLGKTAYLKNKRIIKEQENILSGISEKQSQPITENKKQRQKSSKFEKTTTEDKKTANLIWQAVDSLSPNSKPPNLEEWADTIRLMRERDKRTIEEITSVFLWAHNHNFWRQNIRSPEKLRKQFDNLNSRMISEKSKIPAFEYPERKKESLNEYI